jgi:hypothetical protein
MSSFQFVPRLAKKRFGHEKPGPLETGPGILPIRFCGLL